MKKILLSFIALLTVSQAFAFTLTPASSPYPNQTVTFTKPNNYNEYVMFWDEQGNYIGGGGYFTGSGQVPPYFPQLFNIGTHHGVVDPLNNCFGATYTYCVTNFPSLDFGTYVITPQYATPIDAYVASTTVNSDFEFTTGFSMQGTHQWIGNYLIKNFIGNLYGFLNGIKLWLIALFFFGGVLYFTLRAFSFYRH
jgi:hypothetical protein